jgi:nitrile hydratase subunit beta
MNSLMDSVHDMGGMDGFGKIDVEENEPVFHAAWEGHVLAMQLAMLYAGAWRIDHSRFAQEQLPPITYLSASYYQRWALGMENNIIKRGFATAEELKAGHATTVGKMLRRKLTVSALQDVLTRPSHFRQQQAPALFKPGDRVRARNMRVRARNMHPKTRTRLPRYARGKLGVMERCQGCHVYPDTVAIDQGDNPQWLYTVVFTGSELWGPEADPTVQVSIEAFEPYLESA